MESAAFSPTSRLSLATDTLSQDQLTEDDFRPHLYLDGKRLDEVHRARMIASTRHRVRLSVKRLLDILVSGTLTFLLAPLFLACYFAVKLTSQGPFIFTQPRWGHDERHFQCFKMRTMYVKGDPRGPASAVAVAGPDGTLIKMARDPRVTRPGNFLRRTSIDELPQLLNVLRGDMSLVGPRPLVLPMLEPFSHLRGARCAVRPGITGLWQVRNRHNNLHAFQMIVDDAEYIRELSFRRDLRILCATPKVVLRGGGAV